MHNKPFLRIISSVLVFSFSWSQLVFAEDPRDLLYRAKFAFMDDTRRGGGMDAGTLEDSQTFQENQMATMQTLQDLSTMNFSLTTQNGDVLQYVGNTLDQIERPDGTLLRNIEINEEGAIQQADLQLSDGSIQVYQNGGVIAYLTPDGTEVYYENGEITHTTKNNLTTTYSYIRDGNGVITQTTLDNPSTQSVYDAQGRLTQVTNHADNSTTYYQNGVIQRITLSNGSYYSFGQTTLENQDIQVTLNTFTDPNNNVYSFDSNQNVSHITLADNSVLTDLVWDEEDNSLQNAALTEPSGQVLYFENQTLTRSVSVNATTTYWTTQGPYRGYKEREVTSTGATSYFEYSTDPQGVILAQRREAVTSVYNLTTFQGATNLNYTTNPALRFTAFFPSDNSIDQQVQATATGGTGKGATGKNLTLNLSAGTGSNFIFNGVTTNLGITLQRGTLYNAEVNWETSQNRAAIYVYEANTPRPTTPQGTISDFAWNPQFKLTGTNSTISLLSGSSGTYTQTTNFQDKFNAYQSGSPLERVNFHFNTASSANKITLTAVQQRVGDITRTLTFSWQNKTWTFTQTDYNNVTKTSEVQTFTVGQQPLSAGTDNTAEIRLEGANINLYVYPQGGTRPQTPIGGMPAYSIGTRFTASSANATTGGIILRNMTSPSPETLQASNVTSHENVLLSNAFIQDTQRIGFLSLTYDSNNNLTQALQTDGTRLLFQDNLLTEAFDSNNNPVAFAFQESPLSNLLGSSITQNNLESHYDAQGRLEWVRLDDLTIHYNPPDQTIDYIEKEDGTELHDLLFNQGGNLINAEITTPGGEVRTYQNGGLVSIQRPDTSRLFYTNGELTQLVTPEALTYNFSYLPDRIEAVIDPGITVPDALTPIRMQYDQNFNLREVVRQNNQILNYLNNDLAQIDIPNEAPQVFNYERAPEGNILSYTVTQANTESFYDGNNNLERVVISPTEESPHTLEVRYLYGKIREITKDTVLTFTYSYEFNENNEELALIEDLEEGTLKTYKDELLLTSLNHETSVLSTYSYDTEDRVSRVVVTRLGRELHAYDYSYEGNLTIVQDEEATIRTYDSASQKLLFLEKDNKKWAYSYAMQDGQEIVTEELIQRVLDDGSVVHYQAGQTQRVDLADGSFITDVVLGPDRALERATLHTSDGSLRIVGPGGLIEEITSDGTHFYFENNRITRVTAPDEEELLYSYETDNQGATQAIWVTRGNESLKYDPEGNLLGVRLDDAVLPIDQSRDFVDDGQRNFPVSFYGNTYLTTEVSVFGAASAVFDGSEDYLTVPENQDFDFGAGDFTIEAWVNLDSNAYTSTIAAKDSNPSGWIFYVRADGMAFYENYSTPRGVETVLSLNTWHHVAVTRSGSALRYFLDGIQQGPDQNVEGVSFNGASNELYIGAYNHGAGGNFNGLMDEIRISKGVARYTQDFTPPTQAFTSDSNTMLLLHFDGLDRSYYALQTQRDLEGGVTGYSFIGEGGRLDYDTEGNLLSTTLNPQNNTFFQDQSASNHPIIRRGDTHLDLSNPVLGSASAFFDGNGDYLSIPDSSDWDFGTGDFSIDFRIQFNGFNLYNMPLDRNRNTGMGDYEITYASLTNLLQFGANGSIVRSESWSPWLGQWYHLSFTRQNGLLRIYVDGTELGEATAFAVDIRGSQDASAGADVIGNWGINGWIDELRIQKGTDTVLWLSFDNTLDQALTRASTSLQGFTARALTLDYLDRMNWDLNLSSDLFASYRFGALYSIYEDQTQRTFYFSDGRLSRVVEPNGSALSYSYERDLAGNVTRTFVNNGAATLVYDEAGDLSGLRRNGFLTPDEIRSQTTHAYQGFGYGPNTIDGDFTTAQNATASGGAGYSTAEIACEHTFSEATTLTNVTYRLEGSAASSGVTNNGTTVYTYIQTKDASTGVWTTIQGTFRSSTGSNSGGGGSTARVDMPAPQTVDLNLSNVVAIRACVSSTGWANESGSTSSESHIYEIQWTLADEANYTLQTQRDSQGNVTGYSFRGFEGAIDYDAQGSLLGTPSSLAEEADSLNHFIDFYTHRPHQAQMPLGRDYALRPQTSALLSTLNSAIPEPGTVVSQEYSSDGILETQTKGDGTITLFNENNKPSLVLDETGRVLIEYAYDLDGNPTRVNLVNARLALPGEIEQARLSIEEERATELRALAEERNLAYESIRDQYQAVVNEAMGQLSYWQGEYDRVEGIEVRGRVARSQRAEALGQLGGALDQINTSITNLRRTEADTYAALDSQIQALSDEIENSAQFAFAELSRQEIELKREILTQEVSPVVYDYYRRILGRDPSSGEYASWTSRVDYASGEINEELQTTDGRALTTALADDLNNSPERAQRQAYVQNIKDFITSAVNSYLGMSDQDKLAFAQTLGLSSSEIINLTASDAQKILDWLNSRSLHFGQSAFLSLEALLEQRGIPFAREDLAQRCILVDILTGVISPLDDGDLVISVYAINKVAGLYGLSLTGANISWDDLLLLFSSPSTLDPSPRIIAHINGNHYVVITAITATSITYIDPGIGADGQNESLTVTKGGFLKAWKGNVTLETLSAQTIANIQNKTLSATQTQNIRGAFWGSLLGFIGSILSFIPGLQPIGVALRIASLIASIAEGDWISGISAVVTLGFQNLNFGNFFEGVFHGVTSSLGPLGQVINGIGQFFGHIYNSVVGFFNSALSFLPGIGTVTLANGATLGAQIVNTALATGLSFGVSRGLEAVGINPEIAGFLGSLTAGAVIGGMRPEVMRDGQVIVTQTQNIQASLQQVITLNQVGTLGLELGLDSTFTNILGLSLAAIQGQLIDGSASNLAEAFSNVLPEISSSLAQYGLEEFAQVIGVSPLVARAAGLPILSAIGQGIQIGHMVGQNLVQAINEGLVNGAIAYAADFAADQITDETILNALSSRVISGAIEGILIQQDLFRGMYDALRQSVIGALSLNPQQILFNTTYFSSLVSQNGLEAALEVYFTNIFNRQTVESVLRSGGVTVALASPKTPITLPDGQSAQMAVLSTGEGVLFDAGNNLLGFQRDGIYETGQFGITNAGTFGLVSGKSFGFLPNGQYFEGIVQNGNLTQITVLIDNNHLTINPEQGSQGIRFDIEGNIEFGNVSINDELGLFVANGYLATIQSANHIATTTASQILELAQSFGNLVNDVFLLRPQTSVFQENGICAADMKLEWLGDLNVMFRDALLTQGLFIAISNYRWVTAIADAVPRIVNLMQDAACRFIFTPGVNSGIRTDTNPTGHTMAEITTLGQSFDIDTSGRRVMFAHSAGTEAQLRAILQAKDDGMDLSNFQFVFASPRVTRTFFESAIQQAGLRPDQVLVVTAAGDWPHWPTDLIGGAPDILPFQGAWDTLMSSFFDYEHNTDSNGNLRYNYLFLERDLSAIDGVPALLEHGGMVDGAIADHTYEVRKNGTLISGRRLREIYADFGNGNF